MSNQSDWSEKQKNYITSIEHTIASFEKILKIDERGLVIGERKKEIQQAIDRNKRILNKLKDQEFTIAVVGLEKAGKSTLGNALLGEYILPEYTERCTYTTTEIKAGDSDFGVVDFYSQEEFEGNFQELLRTLEFGENISYKDLSKEHFEEWWNTNHAEKSTDIYTRYKGTIHEDILKMLDGKQDILQLLNKPPMNFEGMEQLKNSDFTLYITGITYYENGIKKTDHGAQPYAVRKVSIQSTSFQYMKNAVLYDVPGFDSPTKLHKLQTEEMLKKADAIILVTNVGDRPNLSGPQIDMLCQVKDEDGILLNEKSFVFGNKIDMAGNGQIARDNIETIKREAVTNYSIAREERIICGSAKAYLECLGKKSADEKARGSLDVNKKLQQWNIYNGIEELREIMNSYYQNERYDVLMHRVKNSLADTEKLFSEILKNAKSQLTRGITDTTSLALQAKSCLNTFKKRLHQLLDGKKKELTENRNFTSEIVNNVEKIYPDVTDSSPALQTVQAGVSRDIDSVFHYKYIDSQVRQSLYRDFLRKIVTFSQNVVYEFNNGLFNQVVDLFLDSLNVDKKTPEIVDSVKNLINKWIVTEQYCNFNLLIERFNTNVIESIILLPFGSPERYRKVTQENIEEFIALSAYFKRNKEVETGSYKFENKDLFNMFCLVLTQKYYSDFCNDENLKYIEQFNSDISNGNYYVPDSLLKRDPSLEQLLGSQPVYSYQSIMKTISSKNYLSKCIRQLSENGILLPTFGDIFKENLGKSIADSLKEVSGHEDEFTEKFIDDFCGKYSNVSSFSKEIEYFREYSSLFINMVQDKAGEYEAFLLNLNNDIKILRDITKNSLCDLIGLERTVISNINNSIEKICSDIEYSGADNVFDSWINLNLNQIYASKFRAIELEQDKNSIRRDLIKQISEQLREIM